MSNEITATTVVEEARSAFMFDHFGPAFMFVENGVYVTLGKICTDYLGGYWQFVELSNGGGYMRLDTPKPTLHLACENYYEGDLSPDAASIVACLYAINSAVLTRPNDENLYKHYYWLRDYAAQHVEAESIFSAID